MFVNLQPRTPGRRPPVGVVEQDARARDRRDVTHVPRPAGGIGRVDGDRADRWARALGDPVLGGA